MNLGGICEVSLGWYTDKAQTENRTYGEETEPDLTPEYRAGTS